MMKVAVGAAVAGAVAAAVLATHDPGTLIQPGQTPDQWAKPASIESRTEKMPFEQCLITIRLVSSQLGVEPVGIVETNDLQMVRYPTVDGSVLVTCSRLDGTMVMTRSPHR